MAIKALADYDFPSRSAQELYGDDELVNVWWKDNRLFCTAATFRVPRTISWSDFLTGVVAPWAASDPEFDPKEEFAWALEGESIDPEGSTTLAELGVGHKYTLTMQHKH